MARIRSVHPGQWTDEDFVAMSAFARLLALAIRNECDDQGVFEWKPITIKMRLFPADSVDISELLQELEKHNQIAKFEIGGKAYGAVRNFRCFQRPKKPNRIHPLPTEFRDYVGNSYAVGGSGGSSSHEIGELDDLNRDASSEPVGNQFGRAPAEGVGVGVGIGEEKEGSGEPARSRRGSPLPSNWALPGEWLGFARDEGLNDSEIMRQSDKFRDYWLAQPGQKGIKADWFATWRSWIRRELEQRSVSKTELKKPNIERGYGERIRELEARQQ